MTVFKVHKHIQMLLIVLFVKQVTSICFITSLPEHMIKKNRFIVPLENVYKIFKTIFSLYDYSLLESTVLMPEKKSNFSMQNLK